MNPNATLRKKASSRFEQWIKLFVAVLLLGFVVLTLIPWLRYLPSINTMIESNNARGIDPTGLLYSESREVAQAENYLRNQDIRN